MEPKKNPKYDVHSKRNVIFNLSLVLSLALVITAFQWSVPIGEGIGPPKRPPVDDEIAYVAITDFNTKTEMPKPKLKPPPVVVNPNDFIPVKYLVDPSPAPRFDEPETGIQKPIDVEIKIEMLDDTTEFIVVETPPEPVGGLSGFYNTLKKNIVYPRRAKQSETEGKVYVQFTVDKTGEVTNVKVIKGIGDGCDEEAARVIGLTKWKPGKQRGKPVRVRLVQPVLFDMPN
jgi:periplasmic protein TonB